MKTCPKYIPLTEDKHIVWRVFNLWVHRCSIFAGIWSQILKFLAGRRLVGTWVKICPENGSRIFGMAHKWIRIWIYAVCDPMGYPVNTGGLSHLTWGFLEDVGDMAGTALVPHTKMFHLPWNLHQYECERPVFLQSYIRIHKRQNFGIDAMWSRTR